MGKRALGLSDLAQLRQKLEEEDRVAKEARAEQERAERERRADAILFRQAVTGVLPLRGNQRRAPDSNPPAPLARQRELDEERALAESLSDEFDSATLLDANEEMSYSRPGVGEDVVRRLRRGHWVIQAELDLHGARREEARAALSEFVRESARLGLRCLRVIHGKGLGSVDREPVLKRRVFHWLAQKEEVLALCQARAHDGGAGALIVLLRPQGATVAPRR